MAKGRSVHRRLPVGPPREGVMSGLLGRFLDPIDALFTVFFSILFVLLFTLSYSVLILGDTNGSTVQTTSGRELFFAILAAVAVWGLIDAVVYVLAEVFSRKEKYRLLQYIQSSEGDDLAVEAIAEELDFVLEPITTINQRQDLYRDILGYLRAAEPQAVSLQRQDIAAAGYALFLSVLSVLPSLLPLLLLPENLPLAIGLSNVISAFVLFATGWSWGFHTNTSPWRIGLLLTSVCLAMVVLAILLGG